MGSKVSGDWKMVEDRNGEKTGRFSFKGDDVEESPMTVDYGRMTPVLVAAIKEQQEIINTLTKRLEQQEKLFSELKAEVNKLQGVAQK